MVELKKYLLLNAAFSGFSGITMLLAGKWLNSWFSITNAFVLPIIGVNLFVFAIIVWLTAQKFLHKKSLVSVITILDVCWVIGSIILTSFRFFNLSNLAYVCIGIVAAFVTFMAYKQFKNNR